jgi:uncharacterized membrane protein YccC
VSADGTALAPGLPRRALAAALARQGELRHAVRVSAAVAAAFALGALLGLPQAYWMVFTAVIVVQTSIGGTITASMERFAGTVVGSLVGAAAAYLKARTVVEEGLVLAAAIAVLAFAAAVRPSLRVAPVTAAIVLVGGGQQPHADPLVTALWRVLEICLGSMVGVAATLLIFPARASRTVTERAAEALEQLAELTVRHASALEAGASEPETVHPLNQATRRALASVEQALTEAARERASGVGQAAPLDGLFRSLSRARSDTVMVGRALAQPLPQAAAAELAGPATALLRAVASEMRADAQALRRRAEALEGGLDQPRQDFEQAVERTRQGRLTADRSLDDAARVFGLVFALESLLANLEDLNERIAELAAGQATGAAVP